MEMSPPPTLVWWPCSVPADHCMPLQYVSSEDFLFFTPHASTPSPVVRLRTGLPVWAGLSALADDEESAWLLTLLFSYSLL